MFPRHVADPPPSSDWPSTSAVIAARWRNVAILSWPIDDQRLAPLVPDGMLLDRWAGEGYISLVCLVMENLRLLTLPALPRRFAEVNLRFYVQPASADGDRRGVVFLRQLVSNPFVAFAGRRILREPMLTTPVTCKVESEDSVDRQRRLGLRYQWRNGSHDAALRITASGDAYLAEPGSLEEFVTARYWGYNGTSGSRVRAYRISREPWSLVPVIDHELNIDAETRFGPRIAEVMAGPPASALLALGSESRVHWPTKLR